MTDFKFNEGQKFTLEALQGFGSIYVLKGYAGTGKTTVITHWVRAIRERPADIPEERNFIPPNIVLTAPTNKATNVLRLKAEEIRLPVDVSTIHSLLSLKMQWQRDQQVLVPDPRGENAFGDYDYVVIDECSMLDSQLMEYILGAQATAGNSVIFMGDPCQLPPIGEKESGSFTSSDETSELTEVMRQGSGNPIQDLALYLRELILDKPNSYPSRLFEFVDNENILHLPLASNEDRILEAFADAGTERDVRHCAWTNRVVDTWNDKIRDKIYGFDREEWTKGERIVTTAPVMDQHEKAILFSTDTMLEIQRNPEVVIKLEIECWKLVVKNKVIFVPTKPIGEQQFNTKRKILLETAKKTKGKWNDFYRFMETFAKIKPAYSMTVHRSQGSTFDDMYVSYANILQNPNRKESLQCLYVAVTRPSKRLILF